MGMWIGGDRDGNPFVTAETLMRSATIQSEVIFNYYISKISSLYRTFSLSTNLSKTSKAVEEMAAQSQDTSVFREKEPYRRAFHFIQSKLIQTLLNLKEWALVAHQQMNAITLNDSLELKGINKEWLLTILVTVSQEPFKNWLKIVLLTTKQLKNLNKT